MTTPSLKSLALVASSARKALDAGAYSSSLRFDAHTEIKKFEAAATPERILQYGDEVLEEAKHLAYVICAKTRHVSLGKEVADAIDALKSKQPVTIFRHGE